MAGDSLSLSHVNRPDSLRRFVPSPAWPSAWSGQPSPADDPSNFCELRTWGECPGFIDLTDNQNFYGDAEGSAWRVCAPPRVRRQWRCWT
jgi:hypothetical protein